MKTKSKASSHGRTTTLSGYGSRFGPLWDELGQVVSVLELNALWLLFSVPLITILPATLATYSVIHEWTVDGAEPRFSRFIWYFSRRAKMSYVVGIPVFLLAGILVIEAHFFLGHHTDVDLLMLGLVFGFGLCLIVLAAWLFPFVAHYPEKTIGDMGGLVIRWAQMAPLTDLGMLAVVFSTVLVLWLFPFALIAGLPALSMAAIYHMVHRKSATSLG